MISSKILNSSLSLMYGTPKDYKTPVQKRPASNGIEGVLYIFQNSKIWASYSDAVYCHTQDTSWEWGSHPSAEIQSAHSIVTADRGKLPRLTFSTIRAGWSSELHEFIYNCVLFSKGWNISKQMTSKRQCISKSIFYDKRASRHIILFDYGWTICEMLS